ncbi:DUF951 domain-containing protein [Dethiothermospora halolimnae]|uniref:DUF951 domain-containing protein n=1 Tax=Dethiothermospora halolimnae TaxID=3114390 RepID=UPI003CCBD9DB
MPMKLNVGDMVKLKKTHPCGSDTWEIMRTGMDFRIRCTGCDRQVWLPRRELEKKIKKIIDNKS